MIKMVLECQFEILAYNVKFSNSVVSRTDDIIRKRKMQKYL